MIYWDTSAIIVFLAQGRLTEIIGVTRPHALSEFYARTTGKGFIAAGKRVVLRPELASARIGDLRRQLDFVEITAEETATALAEAAGLQLCGGRTHDFLHFFAARKAGAEAIYTFNGKDFEFSTVPVRRPV